MNITDDIQYSIDRALVEDLGDGDITTQALVTGICQDTASIVFKDTGVFVGEPIVSYIGTALDPDMQSVFFYKDGDTVCQGDTVAILKGKAQALLSGERLILNFLQRLSGIATTTRSYVDRVSDLDVKIMDTRKTTPSFRALERYAVRMGGGVNHRFGLFDQVLIKENHLYHMRNMQAEYAYPDILKQSVWKCRRKYPDIAIEIEVETVEEAIAVAEARPDIMLLDNMYGEGMGYCTRQIKKTSEKVPLFEASGGVSHATIRAIAETGVDRISIGALTHSFDAVDIALAMGTTL